MSPFLWTQRLVLKAPPEHRKETDSSSMYIFKVGLAGPDSLMLLLPNCVYTLTAYDKVYERIRSDIIIAVLAAVVNPHNAAPQCTKSLAQQY